MQKQIIVIGAGAGGMMAAGRAAEEGAGVLLVEKTKRPGQKILISGNGRCNISNSAPLEQFINMYGKNGTFLYSVFKCFFRDELLAFFQSYGVATSSETDGRIFPSSNRATDVVAAMRRYFEDNNVQLQTGTPVSKIQTSGGKITGIISGSTFLPAEAVIIATGGSSYSNTGSSGDGYRMTAGLGHTIVPLRPALVPLVIKEKEIARSMQGTSLHDVRITAFQCAAGDIDPLKTPASDTGRGIGGKRPPHPVIESRTGDIMFTHFGISGPAVMQISLAVIDALKQGPVSVSIDLKPQLTGNEFRQMLVADMDRHSKKSFFNFARELVPPKMAGTFVKMTAIPPDNLCHKISPVERERLLQLIKSLRFNISSPLSMDAAMVTAGGVSLKEIYPRTMASRLVKGLYFCGEVMDLDAETGGYNLQAAISTGYVSGESAAAYVAGL